MAAESFNWDISQMQVRISLLSSTLYASGSELFLAGNAIYGIEGGLCMGLFTHM